MYEGNFSNVNRDVLSKCTIITAQGLVVKVGDGKHGIIIIPSDNDNEGPFCFIDEVSDDLTKNLFLTPQCNAGAMINDFGQYELLLNREGAYC